MINFSSNKKLLGLATVLLAAGLLYLIFGFGSGQTHTINLTSQGFNPSILRIEKGDTVVFKTTTGQQFWPASNLHPTHGLYPDFDPKQPVEPDDSFEFTFNDEGTYPFHDHIFPTFRGTIIVGEGEISCSDPGNQGLCWEESINTTLESKGLDAAFEVLANLYSTQPAFAAECHGYVHKLGDAAYERFQSKEDFALTPKTSYCGYGFYHGFMEALLYGGGTIEQAQEFCKYAGDTLRDQTSDAEGACYHGIGHGAVDGSDPRAWGNPQAMIDPGIEICERVAGETRDQQFGNLYRCVSGSFNSIEILSNDPQYKLSQIQNDPFFLCPSQPYNYQEACYTNMIPLLMRQTNSDFKSIADRITAIKNDPDFVIRNIVMEGLFHEYVRVHFAEQDFGMANAVKICHELPGSLNGACIKGLSGGHMKYGEPNNEYVKALKFCSSNILSNEEKALCFEYILTRLLIWYPRPKAEEICRSVEPKYQAYCGIQS